MSEAAIIFLLILCIILLFSIILYQRFHFKKGIHARLKEASDKLEESLVSGSDEKVMVFTDDSCCREAVLDFYELLTQKNFQVEVDIPEQSVCIMGNRDALGRILENLMSNAVRYGGDGKYLGVFLHSDEKYVYIDISDKGKGIDKAFSRIFDRLFTLEDSRNQEIQGNGLGLTIAKSLANQLGGDILLKSDPHILTTFTLKFRKLIY